MNMSDSEEPTAVAQSTTAYVPNPFSLTAFRGNCNNISTVTKKDFLKCYNPVPINDIKEMRFVYPADTTGLIESGHRCSEITKLPSYDSKPLIKRDKNTLSEDIKTLGDVYEYDKSGAKLYIDKCTSRGGGRKRNKGRSKRVRRRSRKTRKRGSH